MKTFTFESTLDGSPTLRIGSPGSEELSEAMHSLKGAFSETLYIYGSAIKTAFEKGFSPHILSMGLGLGYVEILAAGLALKFKDSVDNGELRIESFESLPELRDHLISWLLDEESCPSDFAAAYNEILRRTCEETAASSDELKGFLKLLYTTERWKIRAALTHETEFNTRFGCICFDAFSSKSTPEVWGEAFLKGFLEKTADRTCVLSTYACTGNLKRALRDAGFAVEIRPGFSSKRDSTFAVRDL